MFDTALTESAGNTRLTDGIKMTANAAQGVTHTGNPTELGSYDSNESGWQNAAHTVYRHVFTWTTSQGNGRIAAACLTSKPHGYVGEGNSTSKTQVTDNNLNLFTYSNEEYLNNNTKMVLMIKDNEVYFISLDTSDDTLTITKTHIADTECDMRDIKTISGAVEEEVLTVQNPTSTPLRGMHKVSCRVLSESVVISFYAWNRFLVLTFPSNLGSLTSYVEVTQQATSLTFGNKVSFLSADATKLIVSDNTNKIYTVDLSNLANVTEIVQEGVTVGSSLIYSSGKRHYLYNSVYDEMLNKVYPINQNVGDYAYQSQDLYKTDKTAYGRLTASTSVQAMAGRRNDYLATINNLSSVVTKDSTQTMKVIYTLTFAS